MPVPAPDPSAHAFAALPAWAVAALVLAVLLAMLLAFSLRHARQLRVQLDAAQGRLLQLRGRDALTGLLARPEFEAQLAEATRSADQEGRMLALLVVGLDDFRTLNDGYGMPVGDAVLAEAAQRLAGLEPGLGARHAARLGGDEFALLAPADADSGAHVAVAVLQVLQRPFRVQGLELALAASVGVALYPEHGAASRLLGQAALAMRSVKRVGGGGHAWYDPGMGVDPRAQADLVQDLRQAVERGQLQLFWQPKVDAQTLQITAAEALLRWQHPRRGMVSPAVFVPLAERHGLIDAIGRWVIGEACRQSAQWRELGLRMRVAVNISGQQLRQEDLVQHLLATLQEYGIPPARLTCEITESVAMEDTRQTQQAFERLRQAGLHVSIDDFGTGHSSLATLRRLPAAELKIDRAFVTDLGKNEAADSIARAIVQMAHTLGLRVVAEGVETETQRDCLVALGCDELQGYLFAKPMSAAALALWADGDSPGQRGTAFSPSLFDPTLPAPLPR